MYVLEGRLPIYMTIKVHENPVYMGIKKNTINVATVLRESRNALSEGKVAYSWDGFVKITTMVAPSSKKSSQRFSFFPFSLIDKIRSFCSFNFFAFIKFQFLLRRLPSISSKKCLVLLKNVLEFLQRSIRH